MIVGFQAFGALGLPGQRRRAIWDTGTDHALDACRRPRDEYAGTSALKTVRSVRLIWLNPAQSIGTVVTGAACLALGGE
ncbi:hypothetical protein [Streptomyces mirabilis]|uniref:hypothetical protein n=1 Tax=Streptomyces mirabilis TaxID=68239 RepID=UPI0036DF919E